MKVALFAATLLALAGPAFALNANRTVTIALVAKSEANPTFRLTRAGAEQAARDLGARYHVQVKIEWDTPPAESAQAQFEAIGQAVLNGVDGIAVACSDRRQLTVAINGAVEAGIPVACFNSDAEDSKRCYYFGVDDRQAGAALMDELAKAMGNRGAIGILAGNPSAPNLRRRAQAVKDEALKYGDIVVRGTYYCEETPEAARQRIAKVMALNPDIKGWVLVGGWSLYAKDAYPWQPGAVKVVATASMPRQLQHLRDGYVQAIVVQPSFDWGYKTVEHLVRKIVQPQDPAPAQELAEVSVVTPANVEAYAQAVHGELYDRTPAAASVAVNP